MLTVDATYEAVRALGPWLREFLDADEVGSIELAVHEVATNAIDHAEASTVQFDLCRSGGQVVVSVADDGRPAHPTDVEVNEPDTPQVRGYGLMIVEQLAESVSYRRDGARNVWTLTFATATSRST